MKYLFIMSESIFYITFLILDFYDIYNKQSSVLKFSGIILCFLYLIIMLIFQNLKKDYFNKDRAIMAIALFFTVLADVFLLFTENNFTGICFFIIVQMLYLYRISKSNNISVKHCLIIYIIITCIILAVTLYINIHIDIIVIAVSFYFICFINNIKLLINSNKVNDIFRYRFFLIGMILFILCDINVGLYNIRNYIDINNNIINNIIDFSEKAMWLFYLPSQVFLVLSVE